MNGFIDTIEDLLGRLIELPLWKTLLGAFLMAIQFLFGDLRPAVSAIVVLFCLDFLSGFSYSLIKREVSSDRLMRGAVKLAIYGNLLIVGNQCSVSGILIIAGIASIIDGYIVLTEAVSVTENLDKIARFYDIELPFLKSLVKYLREQRDKKFD